MKRRIFLLFLLVAIIREPGQCQLSGLIRVPVLPTDNAFELLISKSGAVWVGHMFGLTRYDGSTIKNFDSGEKSQWKSLVWDLKEDGSGKIWCRMDSNLYCVVKEKLVLIKHPGSVGRLMDFRGSMYVLSSESLIKFDVNTFRYKEYSYRDSKLRGHPIKLFVVNDQLFIKTNYKKKVYVLNKFGGFSEVQLLGFNFNISNDVYCEYYQKQGDIPVTAVISDESKQDADQYVCRLRYADQKLYFYDIRKFNKSRIISVSCFKNGERWISTDEEILSSSGEIRKGPGLFHVAKDNDGNKWFLGPGAGLYLEPEKRHVDTINFNDERITAITAQGHDLLVGTSNGIIYRYDPIQKKSIPIFHVPGPTFGITYIQALDSIKFAFGSYNSVYVYNPNKKIRFPGPSIPDFRGAFHVGDHLYIADADRPTILDSGCFNLNRSNLLTKLERELIKDRVNAVAYDSIRRIFFLSKPYGLVKYINGVEKRILFNGAKISASKLLYYKDILYIYTIKFGLLVLNNDTISQLLEPDALPAHFVTKLTMMDNKLCMLNNGIMQIIDPRTERLIENNISYADNVDDAEMLGNEAFFISDYKLIHNHIGKVRLKKERLCSLLSTVVNDGDSIYSANLNLPYNKNSISFNLSFPVFTGSEKVFYRYKLLYEQQGQWEDSRPGESSLRFVSLKPGRYQFIASAIHPVLGESVNQIVKNFIIAEPWWQTWLFRICAALAALVIAFFTGKAYLNWKLKEQKQFFEKELAVERERQNISREIHDDIGQSLSVIKLNLNMGAPAQLEEAKSILTDVIKDLREFTHNLYYGKLLMEDLVTIIKKDIDSINTSNQLNADLEMQWNDCKLTSQQELIVYRIFQEAINNIIKHAHAKNIQIRLFGSKKEFILTIKDDGVGFDPEIIKNGLGLNNMSQRAKLAGGSLLITSKKDTGSEIKFSITV
jgi:signal transduction histidine kinase